VYSFCQIQQLITKHIIHTDTLKTGVTSKLLRTQEKLDIVKEEEATYKVLGGEQENLAFVPTLHVVT
jgi:hypothetical protein